MSLSHYNTHYFTYLFTDGETEKDIGKIRAKIMSLGGICFGSMVSPQTGECKCEYRSKSLTDDRILRYLSSLKNCRVFK